MSAATGAPSDSAPPPATARPDGIPDKFWDDKAGVKFGDLTGELNRLTAMEAAETVRKGSLPASPADYKIELPADFKPPQGIEFQLDAANPLMAQAKDLMHDISSGKVSGQEAFSKMLGLYAGAQVADQASFQAARDAEIAKLGPTGTSRVTALTTFWKAFLGDDKSGDQIMSRVLTAGDVAIHEKIVSRLSSQGATPYTQAGRQPPANTGKIDGYATMTFEQRRNAQDKLRSASAR